MGVSLVQRTQNAPAFGKRMPVAFALSLAVLLSASPLAAAGLGTATSGSANTLDEELTLKTAITVEGDAVTLGDIFDGYLSRPEKVVAQAPRPGQRMVLSSEQLADIARVYGLDWHPSNTYDRATVYQPGHTITGAEIVDAVKSALVSHGMPENAGLTVAAPVGPVTVALKASKVIGVREAVYYPSTKQFSALVQIPEGDPQAVFVPVRGTTYPTVQIPVLKQAAGKNSTITAEMIDLVALPEADVKPATLTDPNMLIGKTPRLFLKAGQPIRDADLVQITLVDVPVLAGDMDRDGRIKASDVKIVSVNAASVPADAVTTAEYLIGKSPRRYLPAGAPIRRGDVAVVRQIEVPVAARDLPRGTTMTANDVTWVLMNEGDVVGEIATDEEQIVGYVTRLTLKAGQPMRKFSIAKAIAVERGKAVTVMWTAKAINLTAQGVAMEKGGVGDVIRVTNTKSNQTVLAEIIDSHTVRVARPDQISSR